MSCDTLEGWDERGQGEAQKRRGTCILMADSGGYMAETNATL